jgi:hypothetical protein
VNDLANIESNLISEQKSVCEKVNAEFSPTPFNTIMGVALSTLLQNKTINGLRHPTKFKDNNGWYIWADEYSLANDFFKPIHVHHLFELSPQILKYLGLPPGWRFLIDNSGYEDIWYDESISI